MLAAPKARTAAATWASVRGRTMASGRRTRVRFQPPRRLLKTGCEGLRHLGGDVGGGRARPGVQRGFRADYGGCGHGGMCMGRNVRGKREGGGCNYQERGK
ncbi:hypothetical protein VTK73DRAFT_4536 [Phialemonium thermophilum]|uniref:Uncharacterized protein n=1 Tax=Phialemonium thermophilum TaxID=223376 RepID=A0ABR3V853_9PEZI